MSREWPARLVMGMLFLDLGKRVLKTLGVQAPAVITRREQGIVVVSSKFLGEVMVIDETVPSESWLTHTGRDD